MATFSGNRNISGRDGSKNDMDVSVALGGGGAKGNAHIGVLRFLEKQGFRIRAIAGTSFGGMVACFYAAGFSPDDIEQIFAGVDQAKIYARVKNETSSLLGLTRVDGWLHESLGQLTFNELRIPCAVTAVDLRTSNEVVIKNGTVRHAVLSTIALPGIFPSFLSEELELIDGGLLNPVPVAVVRSLAPSLPVVAVALNTPLGRPPRPRPLPLLDGLPEALAVRLGNLRVARALDVFLRSIDIGGRQIAELRFQIEKPEVVIRPEVDEIGVLERVDVHEVVKLGEQAAEAKLADLLRETSWRAGLGRRVFQRPTWASSKTGGRLADGPK
jgi:NTE family protein